MQLCWYLNSKKEKKKKKNSLEKSGKSKQLWESFFGLFFFYLRSAEKRVFHEAEHRFVHISCWSWISCRSLEVRRALQPLFAPGDVGQTKLHQQLSQEQGELPARAVVRDLSAPLITCSLSNNCHWSTGSGWMMGKETELLNLHCPEQARATANKAD